MNQRPDAGTTVRAGRQVDFVVSDGIITRLMPDLRYQSMREVQLDLIRAKLASRQDTSVKNDIVPDGHVIEQDPAPLASVIEGERVNLVVVSHGGAVDVEGAEVRRALTIDDARALAQQGRSQARPNRLDAAGPKGAAARHGRAPIGCAGTAIASYEPVSLQVSAGPNESGYIIRQVHVLASVPVER